MLQRDPSNRPDIRQLLRETIVIEAIQNLFKVLDIDMVKKILQKNMID
jgi:hypothetical protein